MHWACKECIVRACCTEECKTVIFSENMKMLEKKYNLKELMTQQIQEIQKTSPFYMLK